MSNNTTNSISLDYHRLASASAPSPKAKLAAALVKTQTEMGDATKGAKNPFFKSNYADLNAIREAVIPAANANGLVILQPTISLDGQDYIRTLVIHESGEEMHADTKVVCVKQNDPQAYGSAISYARRYGLQAFFNVGAVDDDGEAAQGRAKAAAPAKATASVSATPAPAVTVTPVVAAAPVTKPGTETVVAAIETPKKSGSSFRGPKKTEAVAAATPAPEATKAPAASTDEDWS
jgi:hypothetical protein